MFSPSPAWIYLVTEAAHLPRTLHGLLFAVPEGTGKWVAQAGVI